MIEQDHRIEAASVATALAHLLTAAATTPGLAVTHAARALACEVLNLLEVPVPHRPRFRRRSPHGAPPVRAWS